MYDELKSEKDSLQSEVNSLKSAPANSSLVPLYPNSNLRVDHRKLALCETSSVRLYATRVMLTVFTLPEMYRRNVCGSNQKGQEELKKGLNPSKLNEVYAAVQQKFGDQLNNKNWKTQINEAMNLKLGSLQRNCKAIRSASAEKPTWTKDDQALIDDLDSFEKNPALFAELDSNFERETEEETEE